MRPLLAGTIFLSSMMIAPLANSQPEFDCTAEETKMYIEQVSYNLYAPSPIATPQAFKKAFIEREVEAAAQGDSGSQSCVTIFSDGRLSDEWKRSIDAIRNFSLDVNFSSLNGAALQALLSEAARKAREEIGNALSRLGEDICNMMSTDFLSDMLLDTVNSKYGTNARHLRVRDFASQLTDSAMADAPDNIQLLLSDRELENAMSQEARSILRKERRELWQRF